MLNNWRHFLYFMLGFLPSIFFGSRFLLQWIRSEKKKKSIVGSLFWKLSISGNLLLALHYFIQFQYQFLLIQSVNAFISWRNLNILKKEGKAGSFRRALVILFGTIGFTICVCLIQNIWTSHNVKLLQTPIGHLSDRRGDVHILWHFFGFFGGLLFASRFWIQWLVVERRRVSELTKSFWILSVLGSLSALVYFVRIYDWVGVANYSFGLIPYIRNLMLIRKDRIVIKEAF